MFADWRVSAFDPKRPFAIESLRCGPHGRLVLAPYAEEFVLNNYIDKASAVTLALTLLLFVIALFIKGFTHDLLLEAGVFLVSIKLVLAGYKNAQGTRTLLDRLDRIDSKLAHLSDRDGTMNLSRETS